MKKANITTINRPYFNIFSHAKYAFSGRTGIFGLTMKATPLKV